MLALLGDGFVLGWSVAWPPGPINAEMIRRGLVRGFWPGWSVGFGGSARGGFGGSARGGFVLGFTLALSSPWNLGFWLAVMGQQATAGVAPRAALLTACAVVAGALAWTLLLCSAVRLGARFATPAWHVLTQAATAMVMLFFAARTLLRLLA